MSAQAGIFYFDGRPIEPDLSRRLDAQLAEYGPDGNGQYVAPGLVMVYRALHVTPEDRLERQPYVSERGNVMTWDGRLDNREDLLLQLWRELRDDTTDVALAMAAYEKWEDNAFVQLIGDWSLTVWNAATRSVTLVSDFAGVRSLYYHQGHGRLIWATSLATLLAHVDQHDLDTRFFVGYVAFARGAGTTPYRCVHSVAAGHLETWTAAGRAGRRRFWIPSVPLVRYRDSATYADRLRTAFMDAVRVRLRACRPVWAELSGGLDSSSIACVGDLLSRHERGPIASVSTVSQTSEVDKAFDESPFIEEVERQLGRSGRHLRIEDVYDLDDEYGVVTPLHPTGFLLASLRIVREAGSHVLLSGSIGDLVMGNCLDASAAVLEDLAEGSPGRGLANLRAWSRCSQEPIWILIWRLLHTMAPRRVAPALYLRDLVRESDRTIWDSQRAACERFLLTPRAATLWEQNARASIEVALEMPNVSKRSLAVGLLGHLQGRTVESPSEFARVRRTYPFLHRPLVELILGLPLGILCRPGEPRALMRQAFRPFLPPAILARRSKGYIAPFQQRMLRTLVPAFLGRLHQLRLVQADVIDPRRLQARLDAIRHASNRTIGNLYNIVKLEQWLATFD